MCKARLLIAAALIWAAGADVTVADFIPQCPCDTAHSNAVTIANIRVYPSKNDQVETAIDAMDRGFETTIASGAITYRRSECGTSSSSELGYYFGTDGVSSWTGSDTLPFLNTQADPVVAVGRNDSIWYAYMMTGARLEVGCTPDFGTTWFGPTDVRGPGATEDKPWIVVSASASAPDSQYLHLVFLGQLPNDGYAPYYARSVDNGVTFDTLSLAGAYGSTGPYVTAGDSGQVYVIWLEAMEGGRGIKFRRSLNGGDIFDVEITVNSANPRVLYDLLKPWKVRGRGFPCIGVDVSRGEFHRNIYVSWAGVPDDTIPGLNPDIFLATSSDGGLNFTPLSGDRVNADATEADQWMPAMEIDPYGGINIVYFDSRNDENNEFTEVWLSRSIDGGETFTEFPISTVGFKPCNARGAATGCDTVWDSELGRWVTECREAFVGDYIGLTSDSAFLYALWPDNRFLHPDWGAPYYQAILAPIPILDTLKGYTGGNAIISGPTRIPGDLWVEESDTLFVKEGAWLIAADTDDANLGLDSARVEIIVEGMLCIEAGSGPGRPMLTCSARQSESWSGIRILPGGGFESGMGARVEYASVGVTVESDVEGFAMSGVRIEDCEVGVRLMCDSAELSEDTILSAVIGIQVDSGSPMIAECQIEASYIGILLAGSNTNNPGMIEDCLLRGAETGVAVESGAPPLTIRNVRVVDCASYGFHLEDSVRLVSDTVIAESTAIGIYVTECGSVIDSTYIAGCGYGIYTEGSSGRVRGSHVVGPGIAGIAVHDGVGTDTLFVTGTEVSGYFSGAHFVGWNYSNAIVDSCTFAADTAEGLSSPVGIRAGSLSYIKLRRSSIISFDSIGFYSENSSSDLGTSSSHGDNAIFTLYCEDSCTALSVVHECEFSFMGPGGPDPEPACELKAEYNWWGADPPDSSWFANTDFAPWLDEDPLGKRVLIAGEGVGATVPRTFAVSQNYPNPFNAGTVIEFRLSMAGHVEAAVFNILGQRVKQLAHQHFPVGAHRLEWDGTNDSNVPLASGVYLYRVTAEGSEVAKKMVLLR